MMRKGIMPSFPRGDFPKFRDFPSLNKPFRPKLERRGPMKIGCIIMLLILCLAIFLGGLCTDYVIDVAFGKDLPFVADMAIGAIGCEIVIPIALVCVIVEACDAETPFFNKPQPTTQPAK
jgi:di/tricarboxylate transporter